MTKPPHHIKQEVCLTRAPYREGRKPTAVKVYTIHNESKYLLVQGIPTVSVSNEVIKLFEVHGDIDEHRILEDYPCEQFTETHLFKYKKIQSARFAKRKLDDWSFYGGVLHVCYAPEYETIDETREKLRERQRFVESRVRQYRYDGTYTGSMCKNQTNTETSRHHIELNRNQPETLQESVTGPNITDRGTIPVDNVTCLTSERLGGDQNNYHVNGSTDRNNYGTRQQYGGHEVPLHVCQKNKEHLPADVRHNYGHESTRSDLRVSNKRKQLTAVQQAQSMRQYGQLGHSVVHKRTNSDKFDQTACVTDKGKNSSDNTCFQNEEQLTLPPPPKKMKVRPDLKHQRFEDVARVPSAQACFPAGFDARIMTDDSNTVNLTSLNKNIVINEAKDKKETQSETMQQKVEANLNHEDVVIKKINKTGSVPKFIPRQAQILRKTGTITNTSRTDSENLNKEIRKNAFTLGKVQGPAHIGPCLSNESLDPKEKTVIDSIQNIRKKLTKVKEIKTTD
ncbi:RNA-binding protein 48 [Mactra antiquata]